jgi:hypothetical protein
MMEFNNPANHEIIKIEKPSYLKINDKIVKKNKSFIGRLNRLKRFITGENIEANDPNVITHLSTRLKVVLQEEINKTLYYRTKRITFEDLQHDVFIFVGFHKQPEASIDVSGRYYEDQALNVVNLWRLLPPGWKIILKEHTNAIGDRSFAFYKRLISLPGVFLVNENTDSKLLIEKSVLVATVTGTIAYEAALMKKPAITFSRVFFNRINCCRFVTIESLSSYDTLAKLVDELNSEIDNRHEFSDYLMKNTFSGYITDPTTDPTVLEEENLQNVWKAFHELIQQHARKDSK